MGKINITDSQVFVMAARDMAPLALERLNAGRIKRWSLRVRVLYSARQGEVAPAYFVHAGQKSA